jgi:hypothetical protein
MNWIQLGSPFALHAKERSRLTIGTFVLIIIDGKHRFTDRLLPHELGDRGDHTMMTMT